jgi:RNA ligase
MNFPHITHLKDLLPHIERNAQIRVKEDEETGLTVACYMVQDEDTFEGENAAFERECRGITFYEDGAIAARTLHKFFNIGERAETQPDAIKWQEVTRVMEKRDGSMVTPVLLDNGNVKFKTKKSFSTKEAALADDLCSATERYTWVKGLLLNGLTPTFEVTSPRYPIVICYEKDELTLLHIRSNCTGRYLSEDELQQMEPPFPIVTNLISDFYGDGLPAKLVSWDKLKEAAETREGIEGWVIQFESGEMVKLKTTWYNQLHRAVTFTRWRDIANAVVADTADDLKGAFALTNRSIEPILLVERTIKSKVQVIKVAVELHVRKGRELNWSPKDMALSLREHELFGLIMNLYRGKQPDYLAWYAKHRLDIDWNLDPVGTT